MEALVANSQPQPSSSSEQQPPSILWNVPPCIQQHISSDPAAVRTPKRRSKIPIIRIVAATTRSFGAATPTSRSTPTRSATIWFLSGATPGAGCCPPRMATVVVVQSSRHNWSQKNADSAKTVDCIVLVLGLDISSSSSSSTGDADRCSWLRRCCRHPTSSSLTSDLTVEADCSAACAAAAARLRLRCLSMVRRRKPSCCAYTIGSRSVSIFFRVSIERACNGY